MKRRTRVLPTLLATLLFCLVVPRAAAAQRCAHEAERTAAAATSGVERVRIVAHAGDLQVNGRSGAQQVSARGRACSSDAEDLAELTIRVRRDGAALIIEATDPDRDVRFGDHYAYMDLVVDLPQGMPVTIEDGSGNITVTAVGAARVNDGSGDIRMSDVGGAIEIEDGSGNIEIEEARGDVEIEDGSGDVGLRHVTGSVRVDDGSGEIRIADVTRSVHVDDGSGSIRVERIGGDFIVDDAGSGDVSHDDVEGRVRVGDD